MRALGLRNVFLTGLIVFIPLVATLYLFWIAFNFFDGLLKPVVRLFMSRDIPGVALIFTLVLILSIGAFMRVALGQRLIELFEKSLYRIPVVNGVYSLLKQASTAFLKPGKGNFKNVVLVEYPSKGIFSLGFTMAACVEEVREKTSKCMINVFVPSTPNPTTGFFIMVPEEGITYLDMSVEEAFRLILSGGFAGARAKEKNDIEEAPQV